MIKLFLKSENLFFIRVAMYTLVKNFSKSENKSRPDIGG